MKVAGTGVVFYLRKSFRVLFGETHMYFPTVFAEKDAAFIADFVDRHPLGWRGVKFNEGVDQIVTKPPIREG
jgi:hypothetical protein